MLKTISQKKNHEQIKSAQTSQIDSKATMKFSNSSFLIQVLFTSSALLSLNSSRYYSVESKGLRGEGETGVDAQETLDNNALDAPSDELVNDRALLTTRAETITVEEGEYPNDRNVKWFIPITLDRGGYYACGAEVRLQSPQGRKDDTSANGLRLRYCSLAGWYDGQQTVEVFPGYWGSWRGMKMCPHGSFIQGSQVRFDPHGGHVDDTGMNGLKILCRNPENNVTKWVTVSEGNFGEWRSPKLFPNGKYVKGAQIRYDDPLIQFFDGTSDNKDQTSWQGLRFIVDELTFGVSSMPVQGQWINVASANNIGTTLTESMTISNSETNSKEFSYGFSQSIEAGFEADFLIGSASTTVTVGFEQAFTTSRQVSSTLELTTERQFTSNCDDSSESPTGIWFIWQWEMTQESNEDGPGFEMLSAHWRCTPSAQQPPICPLGFCADGACQTCLEPFQYLSN